MAIYSALIDLTIDDTGVGHKEITEEIYKDENLGILRTDFRTIFPPQTELGTFKNKSCCSLQ